MPDVIHHDAKSFQRSHAEQRHVARFLEDHFIVGFLTFGAQDGVANFAFDLLLGGGGKDPLSGAE